MLELNLSGFSGKLSSTGGFNEEFGALACWERIISEVLQMVFIDSSDRSEQLNASLCLHVGFN